MNKNGKNSLNILFKKMNKNKIRNISNSINELKKNISKTKNLSLNKKKNNHHINNTISNIKNQKIKYYFPESFSINIKQSSKSINMQKDLFIKRKRNNNNNNNNSKVYNQNISTKLNFNIKPKVKVNIINTSINKSNNPNTTNKIKKNTYFTEHLKLNKIHKFRKKKANNKSEMVIEDFLKDDIKKKNKTNEKYYISKPKIEKIKKINQSINIKKLPQKNNKNLSQTKFNSYENTKIDFYKFNKLIGKGNFGDVYLAKHKLTNMNVAIKIISKKEVLINNMYDKVSLEIETLFKSFGHDNVVKLYEVFENQKYIYMIMEYCEGGDLIKFWKTHGLPDEIFTKKIIYQICKGVQYLHNNKILHRDIKLDNILINNKNIFKICDFGISTYIKDNEKIFETPGTPAYLAPEVIRKEGKVNFGTDIWSIGILLFALIYGDFPFNSDNPQDIYKKIYIGSWKIPKSPKISNSLKKWFLKIFTYDINDRINISELLNSDWFIPIKYEPITKISLNPKIEYSLNKYFKSIGIYWEKIILEIKKKKKNYLTTAFYLKYDTLI